MFICDACLSKILITILSPYEEGKVETLTSTFLSPRDKETLPSWGKRRSEISRPDMILILDISTDAILLSWFKISFKIPSILNLIFNWVSYGSKWISDALLLIAWLMIPLINFIIGASLLPLSKSSVAFMLPAKSCRSNSSDSS